MNNGSRRSTIVRIFYGLVLLAVGIAFAGSVLELWSFNLFFDGWWCVLLMMFSIVSMFSHGFKEFYVFTFFVGAALLVKYQFESIGKYITWKLFFACLIIYVALRILFPVFVRKPKISSTRKEDCQGQVGTSTEKLRFGSKNISYDGQFLSEACFSVCFGEMIIDMRGANLPDGAVINASVSFGSITIRMPSDVAVTIKRDVAFGDVEDAVGGRNAERNVTVNAQASFGSIGVY